MAVVAGRTIGEFGHLQRTKTYGASVLETFQSSRGRGRNEFAANAGAAGDHPAGVVIHVLVRQRHSVQRALWFAICKRLIRHVGRRKRRFGLDRHERIEAGLPLGDALQARLRDLARRQPLLRDRLRDGGQRQQCRFAAHCFDAFGSCTRRKVAGSRSNGSVPATGAKPSNAGPMELAMRVATSALTGSPATSAIALISLAVGLVIGDGFLLLGRASVAHIARGVMSRPTASEAGYSTLSVARRRRSSPPAAGCFDSRECAPHRGYKATPALPPRRCGDRARSRRARPPNRGCGSRPASRW